MALAGALNFYQLMEKIEKWDFGTLDWTALPSFSQFTKQLGN